MIPSVIASQVERGIKDFLRACSTAPRTLWGILAGLPLGAYPFAGRVRVDLQASRPFDRRTFDPEV